MTLEKQYTSVGLTGGIDAKTDPKQVEPPHTLTVDNAMYVTEKMLRKRYGYTVLPAISDGTALAALAGTADELIARTQNAVYASDGSGGAWTQRALAPQVNINASTVYASGSFLETAVPPTAPLPTPPDGVQTVTVGGLTYVAWHEIVDGVNATTELTSARVVVGALEAGTNRWVIPPVATPVAMNSVLFTDPQLVVDADNSRLYVFAERLQYSYVDVEVGNTVYTASVGYWVFSLSTTPTLSLDTGTFHTFATTDITGSPILDRPSYGACFYGGGILVAYRRTTSIAFYIYNSPDDTGVLTPDSSPASIAATPSQIGLVPCGNTTFVILGNAGTSWAYSLGFISPLAFSTPAAVGAAQTSYPIAGAYQAATSTLLVAVTAGASMTGANHVTVQQFAISDGAATPGTTVVVAPLQSTSTPQLASNVWVGASGAPYYLWITANASTFLYRVNPDLSGAQVVARWCYLAAPSAGTVCMRSPVDTGTTPTFWLPKQTEAVVMHYYSRTYYGELLALQTDLAHAPAASTVVPLRRGALLTGTFPALYDGISVAEAGFSSSPVIPVPTTADGGNFGPAASSTYSYAAVYVWRDAYGDVHRSAPTFYSLALGATYTHYIVTFGTTSTYQRGTVEWYRTVANGTTHYQIGSGWNIIDQNQDTLIQANRTLYTDSGELSNDPPPATYLAAISSTRAFAVSAEDPTQLYFSKTYVSGTGVSWSGVLFVQTPKHTGPITGLGFLDTAVVIFKNNDIYILGGDGPANDGTGSGFTLTRVPTDCGCDNPRSVVSARDGVYFHGQRSIMRLSRALQLDYVGLPVDSFLDVITAATVVPTLQQLRFETAVKTLVYDYVFNRWSTYSNIPSAAATSFKGVYYSLSPTGTIRQEVPGTFTDNGAPIQMTIETPWLKMAGAQGWGRLYRLAVLGDFKSAHTMTVSLAYDYASTYTDSVPFTTSSGLINGDSVYQFRLSRVPRQIMQAVKLRLQDSSTTGESCDISTITLEVGQKAGVAKLPSQKTV